MIIGRGDWSVFVGSPTSIVLVLLIVLSLTWSVAPWRRRRGALAGSEPSQ
jgi:TctA family transporter